MKKNEIKKLKKALRNKVYVSSILSRKKFKIEDML